MREIPQRGEIARDTLIGRVGDPEWVKLSAHEAFAGAIAQPLPLPAGMRAAGTMRKLGRWLADPLKERGVMRKLIGLLLISGLLGAAQVASAGPFEDGVAADNRGDYATALRLWRPLANQGDADAQYNLGVMYHNGKGVAQDYAEAAKWYRLAAAQGNANAQNNLGGMYFRGQGVAQDSAEAEKWYRLAGNRENVKAQFNLGVMYANGQGVPRDYVEAVKWTRLAANQGHAGAQYNLGVCYANGRGVAQDHVEAHKWFNLAGVGGVKDAVENLSITEGKMTPAQIARAQAMAKKCLATNYKQC